MDSVAISGYSIKKVELIAVYYPVITRVISCPQPKWRDKFSCAITTSDMFIEERIECWANEKMVLD